MDVTKNKDCLYFTLLFQGQRDIPQFTGRHTSYPQSGVTVLLNSEKTAASHASRQTDTDFTPFGSNSVGETNYVQLYMFKGC